MSTTDGNGVATLLIASARAKAQQGARELQAAWRRLNACQVALADAQRDHEAAAAQYAQVRQAYAPLWAEEDLLAAGLEPPPTVPRLRHTRRSRANRGA